MLEAVVGILTAVDSWRFHCSDSVLMQVYLKFWFCFICVPPLPLFKQSFLFLPVEKYVWWSWLIFTSAIMITLFACLFLGNKDHIGTTSISIPYFLEPCFQLLTLVEVNVLHAERQCSFHLLWNSGLSVFKDTTKSCGLLEQELKITDLDIQWT